MLEVFNFLSICLAMATSFYVTFFVSWTYKLPLVCLYVYHKNALLIHRYLLEYKENNSGNDVTCAFVQMMHVPFFACNVIAMAYEVLLTMSSVVYDWVFVKRHPFSEYTDAVSMMCVELNEKYLIYRNQVYNKLLLYVKEIIFKNLQKHHSSCAKKATNNVKSAMKKNINDRIMKLKKKK